MSKVVGAILIVLLLVGGKMGVDHMTKRMAEDEGTNRVRHVLTGLKTATGQDYQTAVCMWKQGSVACPGFKEAADEFDGWAARTGLTGLRAFEIQSAVVERAAHATTPAMVRVRGTVDGRAFDAVAVDRQELRWSH